MSKPVLYSYFRSSASWRVRTALNLKGITYDYKAVSLIKDGGQQHSAEYKQLNPMQQVPTLLIDGLTMTQSIPIIEYLEETRPGTKLLPADPQQRQAVRMIAEIINSGIQPAQNLPLLQHVSRLTGKEETKMEWANFYINKGLTALESVLQKTSGKYCVGDNVSMADLCLVPQVFNALRFYKVNISSLSRVLGLYDKLLTMDEFRAAHPFHQPDCPEEFKNKKI